MKEVLSVFSICILILCSCEKEDLAPKLRRETAQKIMGKWMVQRTINEIYDPLPTLFQTSEYSGTPNDYFDFKTNEIVAINSNQSGTGEESYKVWNPSQVMIGEVGWWIEKLTATELVLKWDRNDAVNYRRFVTRMYFVR